MSQRFDIAVVGSGPAGAACAWRLAHEGYSVALIDEREFPRHKICGEYLNLGAVRELHDLGVGSELAPLAAVLRGMRLFAHDESAAFVFSSPAWSVPRAVLDERLRAHALAAGAQAVRGRVRALEERDGDAVLELERDGERFTIQARFVVGADGMRSMIAQLSGLTMPLRSRRFATGGHYATPVIPEWIEMYAGPQGYLAINPLANDAANVMFVFAAEYFKRHRGNLGGELTRFSRAVTDGRHVLHEERLIERRHAIGPLAHATSSPVRRRVILVGDAARFIDPFTGQGVFLALAGARLAAAAIARAYAREAEQLQAWCAYERDLRAFMCERERVALLMRVMLMSSILSRRVARVLRQRPWDFAPLIDAVCASTQMPIGELARSVGRVLR